MEAESVAGAVVLRSAVFALLRFPTLRGVHCSKRDFGGARGKAAYRQLY